MAAPGSRLIEVGDLFVDELNSKLTEWGLGVTAYRVYGVQYELDQLSTLHVDVQTVTFEEQLVDRTPTVSNMMGINVTVQQKIDTTNIDILDALMNLVIAIYKNWTHESHIVGAEDVTLIEKTVVVYSPELLDVKTTFAGFVAFVFEEKTA